MLARLKLFAVASISAIAFAASAQTQETTLRLSSWLPPAHPIVKDMVMPWAEQVSQATEGRVKIQVLDAPLGPPPAHFDLAANGIADVTFGVHGYTPGRFKLTEIAELPFLSDTSEALSVAYWNLYSSDLMAADEHKGTKLLAVFTHGPGNLFTKGRAVSPLGDLNGAKVRVASSVTNQLASGLGMAAIQAPAPQSYEILSGGVADGIFFPAESIQAFKLDGLIDTALRVEGGLYNVSFFLVMNQAKWDALSDADKAAIDKVSGEAFARLAGKAWDAADAAGWKAMEGKVTINEASAEDVAKLEEIAAPIQANVEAAYKEQGLDFAATLDKLKKGVTDAAAQ